VPQLEVLKHADVFITHGGLNSVHEGLLENVPLVLVPQQVEQAIVVKQVVKFGAGKSLAKKATLEELRTSVQEILDNKTYSQYAKQLGQSFNSAGGAEQAVNDILHFVNR